MQTGTGAMILTPSGQRVEQSGTPTPVQLDQSGFYEVHGRSNQSGTVTLAANLDTAESDLSVLDTQELTAAQDELKKRAEALASATATLQTQEENVNVATSQVQKLTEDIKKQIALANDLFQKSMALADQLNKANIQLPELKERNDQLAQMLANARLLLSQVGMTLEDPLDRRPPPLDANVESVNASGDVEIAAGTHDGIRVGHQVVIVRNGRYIGRIDITHVTADRAVGRVMRDYTSQQIRRGDTATTKLNRLARQP